MKKLLVSLAALFVLGITTTVKADTITLIPPDPDMGDLDHHLAYTWRIDNVNIPQGHQITGARITIRNIANWDPNPNRLFIHLLDNARYSGIRTFTDAQGAPVTDITDDFANPRFHGNPGWLLNPGTADTFLTSQSFTMTPTTFVYDFTPAQVQALFNYISNDGRFALGFDPDCHFFNDWIKLQIFTAPANAVPEPATMTLLGTGLAGLYYRRRRKQQQKARAATA